MAFVISPLFVSAEVREVKDLLVDGTDNTYAINSVEDLKVLRDSLANGSKHKRKNFILTTNLVVDKDTDVGEFAQNGPFEFNGTFDGQGHTITWEKSDQSLFASLGTSATVKNLNLNGKSYGNDVKALLALYNHGTISKCSFSGTLGGGSHQYASIVHSNDGTIERCVSTVTITSGEPGSFALNAGLVLENDNVVKNCVFAGTIVSNDGKRYGISSKPTADSNYYLEQPGYLLQDKSEYGIILSKAAMADKSSYPALDFDYEWKIDGNGIPRITFKDAPNLIKVPVKIQVSVEDYTFNSESEYKSCYFPLASVLEYAGDKEDIAAAFNTMVETYNVKAAVNTANWKKDFLVKQPVEGYTQSFDGLDAKTYVSLTYDVNNKYTFVADGIDFVKTSATYHDGKSANEVNDEYKALANSRVKATVEKLLNSEYSKVGPSIYGNPEFTFICNKLDFYPGNVEKTAQYEALLQSYNAYKAELTEKNIKPDTVKVSNMILAVKALGMDEKAFGENNLIEDLENSSSDNALANNYKIYALYAAGNENYKQELDAVKATALAMNLQDKNSISKNELLSIMPIALLKSSDEEATAFVQDSLIPMLKRSITGFGTFNTTGVNCDVDPLSDASALMLLGLVENDIITSDFIRNDNTVVDYFTNRFEDGVDVTGDDLLFISKALTALLQGNIYDIKAVENPDNQNQGENITGNETDNTNDVLGAEFENDKDTEEGAVLGESYTKTLDQTIVLVFVLGMILSSCMAVAIVYFKKRNC